jgi:hypothetical protein
MGADITREDAVRHVAIAGNVVEGVRSLLKEYLDAGRPGG